MKSVAQHRRDSRRTKLSFDEFKQKTLSYLQTQNVTPVQPKPRSTSRSRALSSGKIAKVVPGGARPQSDFEEEFQIRKIIEERQLSISRVDEVSMSKEASSSLEEEPRQDFEQTIHQLKAKEEKAVEQKTMERRHVCMQVIAQLTGDKSCSFSMSQFELSSGSETEKPSETPDTRQSLIALVDGLLKSQSQKLQFLKSIAPYKSKKLSVFLKGNEIEGVYTHGPAGLHRIFALRSCPEIVPIKAVKRCYRLQGSELKPLAATQAWTADAFST